ncbi:MAG: GNAT family N-acetyltransferase [Eubacterium sp.]|jgi:GNAT superfamily N-acetyltransferase
MIFRTGDRKDFSQCLSVLISAFENYAFFNIYRAKEQHRFFETMMKIWLDNSFRNGTVFVAEEHSEIVAAAVLQAPGDPEIDIVDFSHCESKTLIDLAGKETLNAFLHMCEVSDKACHDLPDPKWYAVLMAVAARQEGKGIGSKMLQSALIPYIRKNGGGLLTFNTNAEVNLPFYHKNGFQEFDVSVLHENGVELGNWSYKKEIPQA